MPLIQTHLICIYGRTHIKGDLIPFQRIAQDFAVTTGLHSPIYFCPLKWIPRSWPLTPTKSIFWLRCCLQPMVDMARSHIIIWITVKGRTYLCAWENGAYMLTYLSVFIIFWWICTLIIWKYRDWNIFSLIWFVGS